MRSLRLGAIVLVFALPAVAFAQTSSSASVQALLAELSALEQQIASLSTTGSASTTTTTTAPTQPATSPNTEAVCPVFTRTLSFGATGSDVANLQAYLAGQGIFSASITGYFGLITQTAVGQWQESRGIVAGGDATTTGLGVVGPKTRAAMTASCSPPATASRCQTVLPPATECSTGWTPVTDASGCAMYFQCSIPLPQTSSQPAASSTSSQSVAATTSCPVVQKPTCTGSVEPYQTQNGCVVSYQCVL